MLFELGELNGANTLVSAMQRSSSCACSARTSHSHASPRRTLISRMQQPWPRGSVPMQNLF
ncbi:MAG TPA: hypothetical protein VGN54_01625, partial [Mycobacteriales bacterium]|nr:hypothetical protein [Mycobacteriales bacterium]